jgi:multimeric flavodoxin WrbA
MQQPKAAIILGSSRSNGETRQLIDYLRQRSNYDFYDLNDYKIGYFDYEFRNRDDDFFPLITHLIEHYDILVFATPIYWYSMSATLKTFLDRFSDLLKTEKPTGRKLRGKKMAVISCASDQAYKDGFYMPFIESANYLGMEYLGNVHGWIENGEIPEKVKKRLDGFLEL